MRKNKFETLLREAVLLDAEERGADAMRTPETEPVPAAARARFEKALANRRVPERETAAHRSAPRRTFARALVYLGASAVCLALVVLVAAAYFKSRSGRIEPAVDPTAMPIEGELLPYTGRTYANEAEAETAMMRFYEENYELLLTVREDLKSSAVTHIIGGVAYRSDPQNGTTRSTETTEAIDELIALLGTENYYHVGWHSDTWREPVFMLSVAWANENGYYSTTLLYTDSDLLIGSILPEHHGITLEPVNEQSWGVYTICRQEAPYRMEGGGPAATPTPTEDPFAAITPHPTEDPFSAITPEPTAIPVPAATPHPTAPPDAAPTPTPTPEPGE